MKLRAMVLKWNEHAGDNVWIDYHHRRRSPEALENELNLGLKNGHWIKWRIILSWWEGRL